MNLVELIHILAEEAQAARSDLLAQAVQLVTLDEEADAPALELAAQAYSGFCARAAAATQSLSLQGLSTLAQTLADGVAMVAALPADMRLPAAPLLTQWPDYFIDYLQAWARATDAPPLAGLLAHIEAAEFVTPLDQDQRAQLAAQLQSPPTLAQQQAAMTPVWEPLEADAFSLALPADSDPATLESVLLEGPLLLERVSETALRLRTGPLPLDQLELAHRHAHTLKGSAAIAGLRGIATLAHALEDVMEAFRRDGFSAPAPLLDAMQTGCEQLELAFEHLVHRTPAPAGLQAAGHLLHAWACQLQGQDVPSDALQATAGMNGMPALEQEAAQIAPQVQVQGEEEAQIRVPVRALDKIFRAVNELSAGLLRLRLQSDALLTRSESLSGLEQTASARLNEIEQRVSIEGLGRTGHAVGAGAAAPTGAYAGAAGFDAIELDRYNELTGATQALGEAIQDLRVARQDLMPSVRELATLAQRQLDYAREARHQLAQARLRPLSDLRSRLRRTVAQTCAALGKQAQLTITGDDLRVDAAVLGPLSDALLHLLRNSVDHGMEPAAERTALGKPAAGELRLSFEGAAGGVVIRLADDGRGLDPEAILDKAVWNGLVAPDAQLTPQEINRLIFLPGFSTRRDVTQTSGRGVGLDVVAQAVSSLQGDVSVSSSAGLGCEFRLFVLASVGTLHALHIVLGNDRFLVPSVQLQQAQAATPVDGDDGIATTDLDELLFGRGRAAPQARPGLLIEVDGQRRRITVDQIVEAREFLIAPPPAITSRMAGISGVATLADGSMALVLDLHELARKPLPLEYQNLRQLQESVAPLARVLVADDSASVRNTIAALLRDANFEVTTVRDGLDAMQAVQASSFAAVITDLEMPQVNGFELAEYIRQRSSQPDVPLVMLTSRGQDKHRARALGMGVDAFLVKPYSDQHLLETLRQVMAQPQGRHMPKAVPARPAANAVMESVL
jgi:chemotaxis protein histidine kinase CheA/ActR/RegA family two-component response regulator